MIPFGSSYGVRPVGQYVESTKGTAQMTMETKAAWKARSNKLRRRFIGGSHAPIILAADEGASDNDAGRGLHWGEKRRNAEQANPHYPQQNLDHHWYSAIITEMPLMWHVVAVCYWTIVILLGWYPWNILLMLLSLPAMDYSRTVLCPEGCLPNTGHHHER